MGNNEPCKWLLFTALLDNEVSATCLGDLL